jgi:hypothetical protein
MWWVLLNSEINHRQGLTAGGVWGVQTPPPPRNSEVLTAELNSLFRGKYIRNNLIRIGVSLICKLSGTPDYGYRPDPLSLCPQLNLLTPPPSLPLPQKKNSWVSHWPPGYIKCGNSLTSWQIVSFSGRALLYAVSWSFIVLTKLHSRLPCSAGTKRMCYTLGIHL